jgi:hypothetical protein
MGTANWDRKKEKRQWQPGPNSCREKGKSPKVKRVERKKAETRKRNSPDPFTPSFKKADPFNGFAFLLSR